jgi:hypothetical protein
MKSIANAERVVTFAKRELRLAARRKGVAAKLERVAIRSAIEILVWEIDRQIEYANEAKSAKSRQAA